jgi:serine phosphatase RsbU (regulator of sigma subunit)
LNSMTSRNVKIDESNHRLWNNRYNDASATLSESFSILTEANEFGYQKGIAYARLIIAACSFLKSDNDIALENLSDSLSWFSENRSEPGYSRALNLKGNLYESFAEYEKALQFCIQAYKLAVEINDQITEAESCSELAMIYIRLSDYDNAMEYCQKSLKIREEMKDENAMASSLNRIGMINRLTGRYEESLECYFLSLAIRCKNRQNNSIQWTQLGLANTFEEMQNISEALKYYERGIKGGDKRCSLQCIMGSGRIFSGLGNAGKAEEKLLESLEMAQNLKAPSLVAEAYKALANHYESAKQFEKALNYHKLYLKTKESVQSEEVQNRLRNIEISYAIEKSEKEKEIIRLKQAELKEAYDLVAEKHNYITASINYASRIQNAILTVPDEIRNMVGDCFILHLPKETVSGDFYWFNNSADKLMVAAGDCTGHGVPGALMSMLGISFLEEIVNNRGITESGAILDELKKEVQRALHQRGSRQETKDGMDIALCVIDKSNDVLQYSGAYNNLLLIRNDELLEYPADRMPIGIFEKNDPKFISTNIKTLPGDMIYMFSDGYADQFGGPDNKKYKYRTLKTFLLKISFLPVPEQRQRLEEEFCQWRGTNPQTDDVLVLGVKI